LPGALPVVNARAIHYGIMIGLALGCEIAPRSLFHRKNCLYPDNAARRIGRSGRQARQWLILLRTTLKQLGVSDVDMSQGSLRCDANVSIRPVGSAELGTKAELKNMNSFAYLERGIRAEIERQKQLLAQGEPVVQETMHYDPATDRLTSLRSKEEAHDYRYFPEPDLLPLLATEEMVAGARADLPAELPAERGPVRAGTRAERRRCAPGRVPRRAR
jgi:Asp-tRNA(Asn)/Glu-tRNA(Gln) amidotransferase B subunit